ncbi:hypothetical protein Taro_015624 [Colocasia esculenta]|uniref:Uncharacterized protein n=1 Tax=Colocasia esculenta TaxID=4460 RepID=A0A843UIB7_COLES|nr:hypothetical protein [Colocasia esculenta]
MTIRSRTVRGSAGSPAWASPSSSNSSASHRTTRETSSPSSSADVSTSSEEIVRSDSERE